MDKSDLPVFFGEWVKKRRKVLDLTQEELAKRAGCSIFALRKIESGERRPSKQMAELLGKSLEVMSDEIQTFIRVARGDATLERLPIPALDSSFASTSDLQPVSVSKHIPIQPTPLVGRDSELAAMERLFKDPQCRLLTLTGMGGIGKTRLAIEFASRQLAEFPGGVYFIPLAPIKSTDAIVPSIAAAFEFIFSGTNDPKEEFINYIDARIRHSTLLVLDNFEHLLTQPSSEEKTKAVDLVSEFLQRLPNVKILTTSRERLNLHGEWTYEMHGLTTPSEEFSGNLDDYSATALFVQSANRMKADFEVTEKEQSAIIQICNLLGGVPLAIELAAAWIGMLSCQEIVMEIHSNIDFLTTSMHDVPERHRSLRATFEHSWKLLSTEERNVLCRLSVFHGGFIRNEAERIAGASLAILALLVSKSLVRRTEDGRYDLHEVIRQYASYYFNENPLQCIQTRDLHCDYYLKFVSGYEKSLKSAAQQAAMWEISSKLNNIRAAWDWAISQKKYELLAQATRSFGWFFEVAGLLLEGIEQLEPLVQALQVETRTDELNRLLGMTLLHQGLLYFRKGQFVRAEELYKKSIAILRPTNDKALLADALIFLGTITHLNGEYKQSGDLLKEGLACAKESNSQWFEAYGIYNLGYVDSLLGNYQEGYEQMLVGLDMWRAIGDSHYIALGLNFMIPTLIELGHFEEAKSFMWESIELCEKAKNRWGMGTAYRYLGSIYLVEGQHREAKIHFQKGLDIFGEYTEGWDIAHSFNYLGEVATMEGDLSAAKKMYRNALRISIETHSIPLALDSLLGIAFLQAQAGYTEQAHELLCFIFEHPSSTQQTKKRVIQLRDKTGKLLSDDHLNIIRENALSQTFEQITNSLFKS